MGKKKTALKIVSGVLLFAILLVIVLYRELAPDDQSAAVGCNALWNIGLIDVTCAPYSASPNCSTDATAAIQKAVNDAYDKDMVVFFPSGNFCISNTIEGKKLYTSHSVGRAKGHELIGSTEGNPPIIKLKANSSGFANTASPKPVIWLHTVCSANIGSGGGCGGNIPVGAEMPASGFMNSIRNLNIEVEAGNPGAVAIAHWGAQDNSLLHIGINLKSGFAGFSGMVGDNSAISDIEVIGGKYGITTKFGGPSNVRWPVMTNVRLYGQSDAAIIDFGITNWMFAGLHIKKNTAPAIVTANNGETVENFTILDSKIEFEQLNSEPAIKNDKNKSFALINTYFKNANVLVKNPNNSVAAKSPSDWNRAETYGHPGVSGKNLINGVISTQDYLDPITVDSPPTNLLSRHSVDKANYPSPDVILDRISSGDKTVANVKDYGIVESTTVDNAPKIQQLIDNGVHIIFFPKGTYSIGRTLELGENTHLTGISNQGSDIVMSENWKPTATSPAIFIRTKNSSTAAPRMSFLRTLIKSDVNNGFYKPAYHFRSGKMEMVDVMMRTEWAPDGGIQHPNNLILMTDNAGGHFYGLTLFGVGSRTKHQDYRHLKIENTVNPIIIYGANPEDQGSPAKGIEIINSKNIALYGSKQENHNTLLVRGSSSNIVALSLSNYHNTVFENTNNIISTFYPKFHDGKPMFIESYNGLTSSIDSNNEVGLHTRGKVDFSKLIVERRNLPAGSGVPNPSPTVGITVTSIPGSTITATPTSITGSICGAADADENGQFTLFDFTQFAQRYGDGKNTCADKNVDYGPCGGRDTNKDGFLNIIDLGGSTGFAKRYFPRESCAF